MNNSEQPTPQLFESEFRDAIRVGFNWERFFRESWPIETVLLESPTDLARCFAPWYIDKTGNEVAYDDPEAVPMKLIDVPHAAQILNEERKDDVQKYVEEHRDQWGVVEFKAPTYALPDDHYFVLDRNHRLAALTLVSVPFKVTLWNVLGPLDPDGLLDLRHWRPRT